MIQPRRLLRSQDVDLTDSDLTDEDEDDDDEENWEGMPVTDV
jgi:hypothetical protein